MTTFEKIRHIEVFEGYQGYNLTEFRFQDNSSITAAQIVNTFLHSDHFRYDSLHDATKSEPDNGYLGRAFNIDKINSSDFKQLDKKGVTNFLLDYLNDPDWGEDRKDFLNLLDKYLEIHSSLRDDTFLLFLKIGLT